MNKVAKLSVKSNVVKHLIYRLHQQCKVKKIFKVKFVESETKEQNAYFILVAW